MSAKELPGFKSEAEEAAWWAEHQDDFEQYASKARIVEDRRPLHERLALPPKEDALGAARKASEKFAPPSTAISLRLVPDDLMLAKDLAAKKGMRYQTYLKRLIHDALIREQESIAR